MDILKAVALGFVQGMTEFLPVSSSGHILLAQRLLGLSVDTMTMTLVLHLGTLFAVVAVFWRDFLNLFKPPFKMLGLLALASLPAALAGLLFEESVDSLFGGKYLGFAFLFTALLLLLATFAMQRKYDGRVGLKHAAVMGLMQALALVPGVSRSGSTIAGGLLTKGDKKSITSFAFLMSAPVILGACLLKLPQATDIAAQALPLVCGFLSSLAFGILSIKLVLKLIDANNFVPFCIYLIVVSVLSFVFL